MSKLVFMSLLVAMGIAAGYEYWIVAGFFLASLGGYVSFDLISRQVQTERQAIREGLLQANTAKVIPDKAVYYWIYFNKLFKERLTDSYIRFFMWKRYIEHRNEYNNRTRALVLRKKSNNEPKFDFEGIFKLYEELQENEHLNLDKIFLESEIICLNSDLKKKGLPPYKIKFGEEDLKTINRELKNISQERERIESLPDKFEYTIDQERGIISSMEKCTENMKKVSIKYFKEFVETILRPLQEYLGIAQYRINDAELAKMKDDDLRDLKSKIRKLFFKLYGDETCRRISEESQCPNKMSYIQKVVREIINLIPSRILDADDSGKELRRQIRSLRRCKLGDWPLIHPDKVNEWLQIPECEGLTADQIQEGLGEAFKDVTHAREILQGIRRPIDLRILSLQR